MTSNVLSEVQAALLNSEGGPSSELRSAMRAVIQFAREELNMGDLGLYKMFGDVLDEDDGPGPVTPL